jgi:hypothetical protein
LCETREELGAAVPQTKRSREIVTPMILLEMTLRKTVIAKSFPTK